MPAAGEAAIDRFVPGSTWRGVWHGAARRPARFWPPGSLAARKGAGAALNACPPFPFEDDEESKSMSTARPSSSLNLNMSASCRMGRHYRRTASEVFLPIPNPASGSTTAGHFYAIFRPLLNVHLQPPHTTTNAIRICSLQLPASGRQSAQLLRAAGT